MKLSHGDTVIVTAGKDKGKKGTVMRVLKAQNRVIVSGINMVTKHIKKTTQEAGKKVKLEVSISASNVSLLDPKSGKPTRVGYTIKDGKKIRIAKKSGQAITRTKVDAPAKKAAAAPTSADAKPGKKSPFWKKVGFGSDAVAVDGGVKGDTSAPAAAITPHRSAGRGS